MSDDWSSYFDRQASRPPRPLLTKVLSLRSELGLTPGTAIDLGCGEGTETVALLREGWQVHAVDSSPEAIERTRSLATDAGVAESLRVSCRRFDEIGAAETYDLVFASLSLQFAGPAGFAEAWRAARQSIGPGGWLAAHLWGVRHDWNNSDNSHIAFHTREEVEDLFSGLQVLSFDEPDFDGPDLSGRMGHWHGFLVVASA